MSKDIWSNKHCCSSKNRRSLAADCIQPPCINRGIIYPSSWHLKVALSGSFFSDIARSWMTYSITFLPSASSRDPTIRCCALFFFYNNQFCTFSMYCLMAYQIYHFISSACKQDTCLHREHAIIIKWKSQDRHFSPTERQIWTSNCSYTNWQ